MGYIKEYLKKMGLSYAIAIILFLIVALIFTYTNINDSMLTIFIYGVNVISVLIGSMFLLRKLKKRGIIYGIIFGVTYFILLYLTSVIFYTGFFVNTGVAIYLATTSISGLIGGIIGVNI